MFMRNSSTIFFFLWFFISTANAAPISPPEGWRAETRGETQYFIKQFPEGEAVLAIHPWETLDGQSPETWLKRQKRRSSGRGQTIEEVFDVKSTPVEGAFSVGRVLRPRGGQQRISSLFACSKMGHIRTVDTYGPSVLFSKRKLSGAMGHVARHACEKSAPEPSAEQMAAAKRAANRPMFKRGQPPKGLDSIWYLGKFVPGPMGYEARRSAVLAFSDKTVTDDFLGVFLHGKSSSKKSNPKDWGRWRLVGKTQFEIAWAGDKVYDDYYVTLKTRAGRTDERLDECWSSSFGYQVGYVGGPGGATNSFATNVWCFAKNGRFSNDRTVAISGSSPTGSSVGSAASDKTGWYRVDGHVLQLIYDDGRKVTTSIGFIDREKKRDSGVVIGRGYFD